MSWSQRQLDFPEPRHIILHNDRIIILEIETDIRTERCTLGEEHKILEHEISLDDLVGRLRLGNPVLPLTENCLLLGVVATTPEGQLLGRGLNLYELTQCVHIPDDLLELRGGHRDDAGELHRRDLDRDYIDLNKLETEPGDTLLLAIQDLDPELRGILLVHKEHDTLVVGNRLDKLEEVDHIDAEHMLLGAMILVEAIGIQAEMDQNRVGAIHRHDLHTLTVELDVGIREDILNGFDESAKGGSLDGADAKEGVGIHSTAPS